jgi:hypothetical protein
METLHNPDRFMADLRQILSQGRKRIGLLVGAGGPLAIKNAEGQSLIPGVDQLTTQVLTSLSGQEAETAETLRTELGSQANIETILSKIRLLEKAIGKTAVNGLNADGYSQLGRNLCSAIGKLVDTKLPGERNAYNELVAWISGTIRDHAVEIFTTNYDLLFEEAFEQARVSYFDGFTGSDAPFFDPVTVAGDDLPARWAKLWKLHGSLGWKLSPDGSITRGGGRSATQLVYPDHLKYDLTQKQPYTALFERLKRFLLAPDTLLLVTGFSFRDSHICAVLDDALAMNANAALFAFQYRSVDEEVEACKLACARPNMSVYASDGAVINGVKGKWRLGDLPKNWAEIRASFWGRPVPDKPEFFLLGDFIHFARFCAITQSNDLEQKKTSADIEQISPSIQDLAA